MWVRKEKLLSYDSIKMELLAPAGDWCMLSAAIKAGCDAVYFGVQGFNMRAAACNFSLKEVKEVVDFCHIHQVKAYCTVNVIIFEHEQEKLKELLQKLKKAGIDAVICWDLAVIKKCQQLGLEIHLSTQASAANSNAAKLWKEIGVKRIVLARECSLENIKDIRETSGIEVECFIHGARCIALSGRCFMSQELFNKSANRGECLQPCRREYKVIDEEGKEMVMENNFVMSAKDLCTLPLLPELVNVGIDCFKIEGRNRGADYVFTVVSCYKKAIAAIAENQFTPVLAEELVNKLKEVYHKGFSKGFYVDYPYHERSNVYGSKATMQKKLLGIVSNFYGKINVAEFKVESEGFSLGEKLIFIGSSTGYHEEVITEMHHDAGKTALAQQGEVVSVKLSSKVRIGDKVYVVRERNSV